jgi:serine/threonine protein kinase
MALEIADGMAYLSSRPRSIVHRDLAARNCLLTADNVVKVGDFGRARDVYESEYYRQTFRGMVPVRWMPPESLRDGEYVSKSDVWSYGVVMWEMATLAEEPYQGMRHDEVVRFIIDEGGKPEIRPNFPESMKEVMEMCWKRYPDDRPSFIDICKTLESYANERFRNSAFVFSDEGREFIIASNEDEISEKAPLRGSSSGGYGNGNTGNSNGDAR